jgi:hypothetical protein
MDWFSEQKGKTNQAIVEELSELQPYTKVVKWNPLNYIRSLR